VLEEHAVISLFAGNRGAKLPRTHGTILIVEDDRELVELLHFTLRRASFNTLAACDLSAARALLASERPDLVLLDINLGAEDGLELLAEIRRASLLRVILLTGRDREGDKVRGLEAGADDYITKPFSHRELTARIRARLRYRGAAPLASEPPVLQAGPVLLNLAEHSASLEGQELQLTLTEFRLLYCLLARANRVVPLAEVLWHVWGYDDPDGADMVRMAVSRLRRKLGETAEKPRLLHTIPRVGFLFRAPAEAAAVAQSPRRRRSRPTPAQPPEPRTA